MNTITGAFSFTGKYVARRLLDMGEPVRTLTNHPERDPFDGRVPSSPLQFDDPGALEASLRGTTTLYCTYWIRFPRKQMTYERALSNTQMLFGAAARAGVRRIVHWSVVNAESRPELPYFAGKLAQETALKSCGVPYAIMRPTLVYALDDVFVNNIAWMMRHSPVFGVPGGGAYKVQPVFADDLASIALRLGHESANVTVDVAGPDQMTYRELVTSMRDAMGIPARVLRVPAWTALVAGKLAGRLLRDVVVTRDEMRGLMSAALVSNEPPLGTTRFEDWLRTNGDRAGRRYVNDVRKHFT